MARKSSRRPKSGSGNKSPDNVVRELIAEMDRHRSAEALNDNVIIPFMTALEEVAEARGYLFNIYGEKSNIVFTNEEHAEQIYYLIEQYMDGNTE